MQAPAVATASQLRTVAETYITHWLTGIPDCRVQGVFAQPSLVLAHRLLLAEALKDSANSMFVLVSESCTPLYHPALFWAQLMAESHVSRMSDGMFGVHRWSPKMATDYFKPGHFRKGSQFSSLTRMHAQYVAYDQHVWTQFHAYCKTQVRCTSGLVLLDCA